MTDEQMTAVRIIRNVFGMRNQRKGDVYPDTPPEAGPDDRILLSCEGRFKRVCNKLIDAGIHPGPGVLLYCTFRSPSLTDNNRNLNGRETAWRREVLLSRGYFKDDTTGRWKAAA